MMILLSIQAQLANLFTRLAKVEPKMMTSMTSSGPSAPDVGTPIISGVSGTVTTGQVVTISGSNMVNEDKSNWDPFFKTVNLGASTMEGATPASDGYQGAGGPQGGTYDGSVNLIGAAGKSLKFHVQGQSVNCPTDNIGDYTWVGIAGGDANDYYWRVYSRWHLGTVGDWPRSHIKMIDAQALGAPAMQYYFQPSADGAGNMPTTFTAEYDAASHATTIPSGQLENDRWYCCECHWKSTGGNLFEAWIDGVQVTNAVPVGTYNIGYINIGIINTCLTNSTFNLDHWMDGLAVSSSRVRPASIIEIGKTSDYATATPVYQAPQFLSDMSIQVKCNLTGLGVGPYWLWVTNGRNQRSAAFAL